MTKKVIPQFMKEHKYNYYTQYMLGKEGMSTWTWADNPDQMLMGLQNVFFDGVDRMEQVVHKLMDDACEAAEMMLEVETDAVSERLLKRQMFSAVKACEELVGVVNMRTYFRQYPAVQKLLSDVYVLHSRYEPDFLKRKKKEVQA